MRDPKEIVREGYNQISLDYRKEQFEFEGTGYQQFLTEMEAHLAEGSRVLDLGCGCGIPTARYLVGRYKVVGVDVSEVQIGRARDLVPAADFLCFDMTELELPDGSFDAVVALFSIIHIPLDEQPALFKRIAGWLKPDGLLLVTAAGKGWTGTKPDWYGTEMYWSHADRETYREWLVGLGFTVITEHFLPEGDDGHAVFLVRKKEPANSQ